MYLWFRLTRFLALRLSLGTCRSWARSTSPGRDALVLIANETDKGLDHFGRLLNLLHR
jgi:hypothetical protein